MKILQVPEGLKRKAIEIADKEGDILIYCEPCYGACDIAVREAEDLGCDGLIHYGHSGMVKSDLSIEYREIRQDYDPVPLLRKNLDKIKEKSIGLVSTVQFLGSLKSAKDFLEENGKIAVIGEGRQSPGQVLGCDVSSAKSIEDKVDAFLYIGSGRFHPLGLALKTDKKVYVIDTERQELVDMREMREKFLKQRYATVAMSKDAKKFGILVSVKPGQKNLGLAKKIKEKLEKDGKKAYILVFNEVKPEKLEGLDLDCYINTACPRIAIEDRTSFKKPILNPEEMGD